MTGGAQVVLGLHDGRLCPAIRLPAPLPLDRLVIGRDAQDVADLLPRLFNLCRVAQGRAARLALGLDPGGATDAEIRRDRTALLGHRLPLAAGLPPGTLVLAPLPENLAELRPWAAADGLAATMVRHLVARFEPGEAAVPALPLPSARALRPEACENSPAGRRAAHPLLRAVEGGWGRGPLWRYLGLLVDADAPVPPDRVMPDGTAVVAAARGAYALRLTQTDGRVTGIARRTPTDDILCPGGALEQSLAALPAAKADLAPLVIALHDPCIPVTVTEAADA